MRVTRREIVLRGLANRCPNCGADSLFESGHYFKMKPACPSCAMRWDNDPGAFLGSAVWNYGVSVFGLIVPAIAVAFAKRASTTVIISVAAFGALVIPLVLYRPSKGWWFMSYYYFFPQHLPANRRALASGGFDDEI